MDGFAEGDGDFGALTGGEAGDGRVGVVREGDAGRGGLGVYGVVAAVGALACVAGHVGVGVGQCDDVGGVFQVHAGREGAGPDDAVRAAERAQAAIGHGDVGVAEVADLLAEGDGQRSGLTGLECFVGQLEGGCGGLVVNDVVAADVAWATHGSVACQVGVGQAHLDRVAQVFHIGVGGEGGRPSQAAIGAGQIAHGAVVSADVTQVKGGHFLAESDGDGGNICRFERGFADHQALHGGGGDVHAVAAVDRHILGVACGIGGKHDHTEGQVGIGDQGGRVHLDAVVTRGVHRATEGLAVDVNIHLVAVLCIADLAHDGGGSRLRVAGAHGVVARDGADAQRGRRGGGVENKIQSAGHRHIACGIGLANDDAVGPFDGRKSGTPAATVGAVFDQGPGFKVGQCERGIFAELVAGAAAAVAHQGQARCGHAGVNAQCQALGGTGVAVHVFGHSRDVATGDGLGGCDLPDAT